MFLNIAGTILGATLTYKTFCIYKVSYNIEDAVIQTLVNEVSFDDNSDGQTKF